MTHASVFSGIGGPEVAATMLGWDNLFHCEINPFGKRVLDYWYPNAKSYDDITTTDFSEWRGKVNVLTGGFPCQPFSYAGQRRGAQDDRYLWPYMFRCIDQIQPDWVVGENVGGILTMVEQGEVSQLEDTPTLFDEGDSVHRYEYRGTFTLERICHDLETHGYEVQPILIPACGVGAPHKRDRVFIIGHRLASDTDDSSDGRTAREDESESGEEWLQEWDEVRQSDIANQVRRESTQDASADTSCSREGTSRKSQGIEGIGSDPNIQPSKRVESSERTCGFHDVLRHPSDASDAGLQHGHQSASERSETGEVQGQRNRSFWDVYAETDGYRGETSEAEWSGCAGNGRWEHFPSVSPVHRGNDGLPFNVDDLTIPFAKWRTEALKAYGNAIVPQVMYEIFRAIEQVQQQTLFQV